MWPQSVCFRDPMAARWPLVSWLWASFIFFTCGCGPDSSRNNDSRFTTFARKKHICILEGRCWSANTVEGQRVHQDMWLLRICLFVLMLGNMRTWLFYIHGGWINVSGEQDGTILFPFPTAVWSGNLGFCVIGQNLHPSLTEPQHSWRSLCL